MLDKIKKGNDGEQLAADFLINKGFEIVARNYRYKHSEIDLIIKRANWLIFVEVKTRSSYA
jgi:putative endonuclease